MHKTSKINQIKCCKINENIVNTKILYEVIVWLNTLFAPKLIINFELYAPNNVWLRDNNNNSILTKRFFQKSTNK